MPPAINRLSICLMKFDQRQGPWQWGRFACPALALLLLLKRGLTSPFQHGIKASYSRSRGCQKKKAVKGLYTLRFTARLIT